MENKSDSGMGTNGKNALEWILRIISSTS